MKQMRKVKFNKINYFWYYKRSNSKLNFGDDYNLYLFRFIEFRTGTMFYNNANKNFAAFLLNNIEKLLNLKFNFYSALTHRYKGHNFVSVGSILDKEKIESSVILGSGFISDNFSLNNFSENNRILPLALRGRYTKKILEDLNFVDAENSHQIILGDPGLLAPLVFPMIQGEIERISFDVLIILHYAHIGYWRELVIELEGLNAHVISAENRPDYVLSRIKQAKLIVSSSLHGIIFAHSVGKVAVALRFPEIGLLGGDFKFNDYQSVFKGEEREKLVFWDKDNLKSNILSQNILCIWKPHIEEVRDIQFSYLQLFDKLKGLDI